jgi:ribosomal protein S18 acetylase RimI-like enzyme
MECKLVECSEDFWEDIRILRNSENNLSSFISNTFITQNDQIEYMRIYAPNYRVILFSDKFVGYVGCVNGDFRICIDAKFRGKGIASCALKQFFEEDGHLVKTILVRKENESSIKLFERNGFHRMDTNEYFINFAKVK